MVYPPLYNHVKHIRLVLYRTLKCDIYNAELCYSDIFIAIFEIVVVDDFDEMIVAIIKKKKKKTNTKSEEKRRKKRKTTEQSTG